MSNKTQRLNNQIRAASLTGLIKTNDIFDGYHTFGELYEHRIALFCKLCELEADNSALYGAVTDHVWKSKKHSDGSEMDGWFIAGIGVEPGKQITYHIPISMWDSFHLNKTLDKAPEFDGHTSAEVLERLKLL